MALSLVAMAGTLPPLFDITDSDEGGYAAVAVYTLLALTLVIVVARLSARWYIGGVLHSDDILLAVSTVCDVLACYIPGTLGSNQGMSGDSAIRNTAKYIGPTRHLQWTWAKASHHRKPRTCALSEGL